MKLTFKSGLWTGKIAKEKKVDLWKALRILQAQGFNVFYEPPPYALQIRVDETTFVSVYGNGSITVRSRLEKKQTMEKVGLLQDVLSKENCFISGEKQDKKIEGG